MEKPDAAKGSESKYDPDSRSPGKHDTRSTIEDELDLEVIVILKDVEKSSANFIDDVWKSVVSHIGAVKLLSYLGHIFSLSLDFQTLMWQPVFTE